MSRRTAAQFCRVQLPVLHGSTGLAYKALCVILLESQQQQQKIPIMHLHALHCAGPKLDGAHALRPAKPFQAGAPIRRTALVLRKRAGRNFSTGRVQHAVVAGSFRSPSSSNAFTEELVATANYISQRGKGILASDESNATTGKRLATVGVLHAALSMVHIASVALKRFTVLQGWTTQRQTGGTGGRCCTQHQDWASTFPAASCSRQTADTMLLSAQQTVYIAVSAWQSP